MSNQRYMMRGVSASKEDVHNAIKNIDKGIFPQAFCKIIPDILGGDPEYCNIMHADGAGTKSSLAYMYWKETGDLSVWKGIAQDALIMNIDDLLCVGAVDNILVSSTIGRNKLLIPGEVISKAEESFIDNAVRTVDDRHLQCDIFLMDALRDEFRFDEISVICGNKAASSDESGILRVPEQPPQLALKKVHVIFLSF